VLWGAARTRRSAGRGATPRRTNVAAFGDDDSPIVVNSAGCGAMLKEYGHLVEISNAFGVKSDQH